MTPFLVSIAVDWTQVPNERVGRTIDLLGEILHAGAGSAARHGSDLEAQLRTLRSLQQVSSLPASVERAGSGRAVAANEPRGMAGGSSAVRARAA